MDAPGRSVEWAPVLLVLAACAGHRRTVEPEPAAPEPLNESGEELEAAEHEPGAEPERELLSGLVSVRERGRWGDGESDQDLYAVLDLNVGDERADTWSGHLLGTASLDLDGGDRGGGFAFFSLEDTYDSRLRGFLHDAYVDARPAGAIERVRIGRQIDNETPEIAWFDGLALESRERGTLALRAGLYGGVPVRQFESSGGGDLLVGTWLEARPWKGGSARLDWMHLEDSNRFGDHDDDLLGLELSQTVGRRLQLEGAHTRLGDVSRDVRLAASWFDERTDLVLRAVQYWLIGTQRDLSFELDPLYPTLFELFPYSQTRLSASKGLGEHVDLDAGLDLRRVSDDSDVGANNRDFERYHLTCSLLDLLPAGLELSLTGEVWDDASSDVSTWGADLTRRWDENRDGTRRDVRYELSAGSTYQLFKYDLLQARERDDVRTWYLRARRRHRSGLGLDLRYEFEDDDGDPFHILRGGASWRF